MLKRRAFLCGAISTALVGSRCADAQQAGREYRVGFLSGTTIPDLFEAFRQGLRERGWIEGQNFTIEHRSAEAKFEKVPELAAELVRRNVHAIVVSATAIAHLRGATANTPVVFVIADDPTIAGYVASLSRPGGHMTGLTSLNVDLDGKRLEIVKAALPSVRRVGVLSSPHDQARGGRVGATERAARAMGVQLTMLDVPTADVLAGAFDAAGRARLGALTVLGSPIFRAMQGQIAALAWNSRMPVVSAWRELPDAGGLMSYGTSVPGMFRRAATYVDRILRGASPDDLPVEQADQFEMVINLRTARALGLTIPPSLVLRADQVIE